MAELAREGESTVMTQSKEISRTSLSNLAVQMFELEDKQFLESIDRYKNSKKMENANA